MSLGVLAYEFTADPNGFMYPVQGDPEFVRGDVFLRLGRCKEAANAAWHYILLRGKVVLIRVTHLNRYTTVPTY